MATEHHEVHHHHHHHGDQMARRFENLIGVIMVIAIAILAVGLIYGIMQTGSTPSYLQ